MKTLREMMDIVESAQSSPVKTHTKDCGSRIGRDCDCSGTLTHANDCGHRYGHDCDCGLDNKRSVSEEESLEEGFFGDVAKAAKSGWDQGVSGGYQKQLRARIDPAYQKLYDIASVKTRDDAIALGKKARTAGHVLDETREEELDRKFNSPEQLKKDADYRAYRAGVKQSRKEQPKPLEEETQEYTVRVVDEEDSGYTVKVHAASEQQALHKAIVKVRNQYDAYPEHARIIRQGVEEESLEETEDPIKKIDELFKDR